MNLFGKDVIINPLCDNVARMTPSAEFRRLMTPEMVDDLEAWMLKRFGTSDQIYQLGNGTVVMGPRSYAKVNAVIGIHQPSAAFIDYPHDWRRDARAQGAKT